MLVQSPKQLEQSFYDSMHVISHSQKTVDTYRSSINHLRHFLDQKYQFDEMTLKDKILSGEIDVYKFISQFIVYLDKLGIMPKGIRSYLSGVKGYLRFIGIRIISDDYKTLVKIPKIIKTQEVPITKKLIHQILRNANSKLQTAVLVASSSGLRLGELVQLRISDIDFTSNPTKIRVRASTAKGKMARETFITKEATLAIKDYLKKNYGWDENHPNLSLNDIYIFGRTSKNLNTDSVGFKLVNAKQSLHISLQNHIKHIPDLLVKNENGRNSIHFHGFRKFFRTTVGNVCGRDYAEALMGHGFYMDTYYQLPEDKKIQMYLDAESHLTISDFEAVEKDMKVLSTKYQNLESKIDDLMQYLRTNSIKVPDYLQ